jgi:ABC-type dipeptide/oligopeptide/nickel transport system permease component
MFFLSGLARVVRSGMLDHLSQDYIRTARAKGLSNRTVVMGHAFRNTLIPVVAFVALSFGEIMSGAVVTETIFAWPGIGRLLVVGVMGRDYPVVQSCVLILAALVTLTMILADLLNACLDPRLRR